MSPPVAGPAADAGMPDADPSVSAIEYAMNANGAAIYACGKRARASRLNLRGDVVLAGEFGDSGALDKLRVVSDTTGNSIAADCLVALFKRHNFGDVMKAGDKVQLPFRFVPPVEQYTVDSQYVSAVGGKKTLLSPGNTGNPKVHLWLHEVGDGESLVHRGTTGKTRIRLVMTGGGTWDGKERANPGSAVYDTADTARFDDTRDKVPSRVLVLEVPSVGPEVRAVRDFDSGESLLIAGDKAIVDIIFDASAVGGNTGAYLGLLDAEVGMKVPEHVHGSSTEVLFILAGEGMMTVNGNPEPVHAGLAIQIPPGAKHSLKVVGETNLHAFQFYTPSGPEQRFKPKK